MNAEARSTVAESLNGDQASLAIDSRSFPNRDFRRRCRADLLQQPCGELADARSLEKTCHGQIDLEVLVHPGLQLQRHERVEPMRRNRAVGIQFVLGRSQDL